MTGWKKVLSVFGTAFWIFIAYFDVVLIAIAMTYVTIAHGLVALITMIVLFGTVLIAANIWLRPLTRILRISRKKWTSFVFAIWKMRLRRQELQNFEQGVHTTIAQGTQNRTSGGDYRG